MDGIRFSVHRGLKDKLGGPFNSDRWAPGLYHCCPFNQNCCLFNQVSRDVLRAVNDGMFLGSGMPFVRRTLKSSLRGGDEA
jgi:hypothetical protein